MERRSTDFLSRQVTFQISLPVSRQTLANVVHATRSEDRTPHRTHHRRAFFSSARHFINEHALAQERVEHSSLRFLKCHLVVTCYIASCSVSLIPLLAFLPRWLRNQAQPASIHGAVHGLAEWLNRAPSHKAFSFDTSLVGGVTLACTCFITSSDSPNWRKTPTSNCNDSGSHRGGLWALAFRWVGLPGGGTTVGRQRAALPIQAGCQWF